MPPLGSGEFTPRPKSRAEQLLEEELNRLKYKAAFDAVALLPQTNTKPYDAPHPTKSVVASYHFDDQPANVWTRAWLEGNVSQAAYRYPVRTTARLLTDSVKLEFGNLVEIEGSRTQHMLMTVVEGSKTSSVESVKVTTPGYADFSAEQRIEFMGMVDDTLVQIDEQADIAYASPTFV